MALSIGCDAGESDAPPVPRGGELPLMTPPPNIRVPAPLPAAHCDVNVENTGVIDLEAEYLPGVVTCENGGANLEALKAQAIAARSVAYYNMETEGQICDSQACQVFSCASEPSALAIQAVQETSGLYLMYNDTLTYGFYVAGDNGTAPPACVGVGGSTEQWITYNSGRSGSDVEQSNLGLVIPVGDPLYGQNRGCMGQWGARCLENDNGADYLDILRFYYGEDIEVIQAEGPCIDPVDTTAGGDSTGDAPDETSTGGEPLPTTTNPTGASDTGVSGGTGAGSNGGGTGEGGGDQGSGAGEVGPGPTGVSGGESGAAGDGALPAGFGEDATNSSCACSSGRRGGWRGAGLFALVLLGLRRRRG